MTAKNIATNQGGAVRCSLLAGLMGLLAAACSSVCCPPETHRAEPRRFVVLQATPLPGPQGGPGQILVDARVLTVHGGGAVDDLAASERIDCPTAPVWVAGTQELDAGFGAVAGADAKPRILALDGQSATIVLGETLSDSCLPPSRWHIEVTPTVRSEAVHMAVAYRHYEGGRLLDSVPTTSLEGLAGRVFIIESLPPALAP